MQTQTQARDLRARIEQARRLGTLLVQMFSYEQDSTAGRPDQTYYEQVHRMMEASLPRFLQMCVEGAPRILEKEGRRITKQIAEWQSELTRVDDAQTAFATKRQNLDTAQADKKPE